MSEIKRGGRRSRDKGNRGERAIVKYLQERGFAAERVPLSGSAGGRFSGDLSVPVIGRDLSAEVKVRGTGFTQLYDWLDGRDLLIVRADRREPLVVLPLRLAADIALFAERGKATDLASKEARLDPAASMRRFAHPPLQTNSPALSSDGDKCEAAASSPLQRSATKGALKQ